MIRVCRGVFVIVIVLATSGWPGDLDCPLRIAVIGDRTGGAQPGVYDGIVQEIQRLMPDLVLTVGDMIEGPAPDSAEIERRWMEYEGIVSPVPIPLYLAPGNNDIWDAQSLALYRRHAGEPYYSFDVRGCHLVILDTSRWETSTELPRDQVAWLARDLTTHRKATWTLVFFHKPFWLQSSARGRPDELHELFVRFGVDAVFTGHVHTYMSGIYDGVRYTSVGSSGGYCEPGPTGLDYHFLWVTVDSTQISIAPLRRGSVLPWDEVTTQDVDRIEEIADRGLVFGDEIRVTDPREPIDAVVTGVLRTLVPDLSITDTLRWDVVPGWTTEPRSMAASLPPPDSLVFTTRVMSAGLSYPLPALTLSVPYRAPHAYRFSWEVPVRRMVACPRVATGTIVLDGRTDESGWGTPTTRLFTPPGSPGIVDSTAFWFAHDDSSLYLAVWCQEARTDSLRALVDARDGPVYSEDCVGYFIQPDRAVSTVYQLYLNPRCAVFDRRIEIDPDGAVIPDLAWNATIACVGDISSDGWTLEIRLPAEALGGLPSVTEWGINFRRKQWRTGAVSDWQVPIGYEPGSLGILAMR